MKGGGPILWNAIGICETSKTSEDVKTLYERRFGESSKGPIILFGVMVEYYPISARDLPRIHQFVRKYYQESFLAMC